MKNNAVIRLIYKAVMISGLAICGLEAASAQEYVNTPVSISKEKVKTADGKICYSHIVLEKQTLFSIAKAYNVTVDELYAINPTLKEMGLKKNSIILIPVKEDVKAEAPAVQKYPQPVQLQALPLAKNRKQKTHVAKWYEDLDAIAEKYGVSTAALMKANNLTEKKLANRQKLVIPDPEEYPETTEESTDTEGPENPIDAEGDMLTENSDSTVLDEEHPVSMTLILPLKAGEETMSRNNMDFYSGVLIAVRDLADKGISTTMNVYDSTDPSHPVTIDDLNSSNLIIGPVSSADLKRMTDSMPTSCDIISPLDQRAESIAYTKENFIQVPTPHRIQYEDLMAWIKEDMSEGDKVFIISEKGARQTEAIMQMKEAIDSSHLAYTPFSYNILEGRDITEPLIEMMAPEGVNRVFIVSESEAFVNDVVRNLNILIYMNLKVTLYAPSKIRSFETIEVENLHNTNLHVSLAYYIDYDSPQVQNFILKYRGLFMTEPTQFAFQGYDTAKYFISLCSKYGENWSEKLDAYKQDMLQSTFKFHKAEEGGYINQGIRRLVYGGKWTITSPGN